MSDEPNHFDLRSCTESLASGNGNRHKATSYGQVETDRTEERKVYLKRAVFCLAVAALLILADALGHKAQPLNSGSDGTPMRDLILVVHPRPKDRIQAGLVVQFRLSNMGRQAILYAVRRGTDVPVGEILVRNSTSSGWINPSDALREHPSGVVEASLAWIEMPPGGWTDGEFYDQAEPAGSHAYAVFVRPDRNGAIMCVISEPYHYAVK